MKYISALALIFSLSAFAQTDQELDLCYRAANKEAAKVAEKANDVRIGYNYCQATSQGQVKSNPIIIRNWVNCHYGRGMVIDVELVLKKSWITRETLCKVRGSEIVSGL